MRRTASSSSRVRLYLVRHGESRANKWGLIAGQDDVPLTESGVQEAKQLGSSSKWIQSIPFWRIYSSDLSRARDTALHALQAAAAAGQQRDDLNHQTNITDNRNRNIHLDKRLRERSYGLRQGFSRQMSEEEILQIWRQYDRQPPQYETDEDLWQRGKEWILEILQQVQTVQRLEEQQDMEATAMVSDDYGETGEDKEEVYHILVTAHAGLIREMILHLLPPQRLLEMGAQFEANRNSKLIIPNTSVTILELDPGADNPLENVRVLELTNAHHLQKINIYDD